MPTKKAHTKKSKVKPSPMRSQSKQPRKELLLQTAYRLFNAQGYHATGIDQILAESGVAKATLYKYFASKDDLILAVLKQRHDELETFLLEYLAQYEQAGPFQQVLAVFDAFDVWFQQAHFYGCNYINASAEYAQFTHPIHLYAAEHKNWLKDLLKQLLRQQGLKAKQAEEIAQNLLLLLDGAIVAAQVRNERNAAQRARGSAEIYLKALAL